MGKPTRTAAQLREMVMGHLGGPARPSSGAALTNARAPMLSLPHEHPRDPLGRNWDIAQARNLGCVRTVRVLIDQLREAYDLDGGT